MAERPNTIQVEIFGQVYSVKAGKEPGYIEHIAAYVDAQMREVSRAAAFPAGTGAPAPPSSSGRRRRPSGTSGRQA